MNRLWSIVVLFTAFLMMFNTAWAQDQPTIEVFVSGRGPVGATEETLFCRINPDGLVEYDSREKDGFKHHRKKATESSLRIIAETISSEEFKSARRFYNSIESLKDALFFIRIVITDNIEVTEIVIKDYTPMHPKSESAYPKQLVRLLDEIQRVRPLSKFERKNNFTLELPY